MFFFCIGFLGLLLDGVFCMALSIKEFYWLSYSGEIDAGFVLDEIERLGTYGWWFLVCLIWFHTLDSQARDRCQQFWKKRHTTRILVKHTLREL